MIRFLLEIDGKLNVEGQNCVWQFLSNSLNPKDPSNNVLENARIPVKLETPGTSLSVKLSDNISGITLNQGFSISLQNNDGHFDDEEYWNLFNAPVRLKKAVVENPEYKDFKTIRSGLVENATTSFDSFYLDVAGKFRAMDNPVCYVICGKKFEEKFNLKIKSSHNRNIPIVYGRKRINILELAPGIYYSAEGARDAFDVQNRDGLNIPCIFDKDTRLITFNYYAIERVHPLSGVFDRDNKNLDFRHDEINGLQMTKMYDGSYPSNIDRVIDISGNIVPHRYDRDSGLVTFDTATNALVVGYADNRIGCIIRHLVKEKAGVPFIDTNWDITEFERYNNSSARINIVIEKGTVRNAIQEILKNDMAFFIQKLDGRFTMRKYGVRYGLHKLPSWAITKKPEKSWASAQENYFSSCVINYDFQDSDTYRSLYFTDREREAIAFYRREVRRTFNTNLVELSDARNLAILLASRYLKMKQTLRLSVGIDTSGFELLDTISIDVNINGRRFSKAKRFIIKEINPAQDILVLEEADDIYLVTHRRQNIVTSRKGGKRIII